jgi:hypothetical protein
MPRVSNGKKWKAGLDQISATCYPNLCHVGGEFTVLGTEGDRCHAASSSGQVLITPFGGNAWSPGQGSTSRHNWED